jgi:2-polyprenyl-3-methyl-5-hydroxy-6-metoxy-1,4-benzoquinol methylase
MSSSSAIRSLAVPAVLPEHTCSIEFESVACLHCGGHDLQTVIECGDRLTQLGGHFRVVRCQACGLAFTNPRPTERSIGLFYPETYSPYSKRTLRTDRKKTIQHRLEHAVLRSHFGYPPQPTSAKAAMMGAVGWALIRTTRRRNSWIPFRAPGRLLDFGCGAGNYMKRMREHGWRVEGIDSSPRIAEQLRQSAGLRAHVGTLPHPNILPDSFDAITMWHSLEHVHAPRGVLRAAREALRPGGLLVVGVPNFGSWAFRRFQHHWKGLDLPRHLTHFTPQTLTPMVEAERFRVLSVAQVGHGRLVRESARRAHNAGSSGLTTWASRPLMSRFISDRIANWAERTGQGDRIWMIAEKV